MILIPWFREFVLSLLIVLKFLRNNQEARRLLAQLLGRDIFTLYFPTITRWYSLKGSAGRLLKIEDQVRELGRTLYFANRGEQALDLIIDNEFWDDLKVFDVVMHAPSKFTLVLESDCATVADFVFLYVMMCAQVLRMGADNDLQEVQSGLYEVTMDRWCRIFLSSDKSSSMRYIVLLATFLVHPRYARLATSVEDLVIVVYEWLVEYCGKLDIGGPNLTLDAWEEIDQFRAFVTKMDVSRQPLEPFWISARRRFPILGQVAPRLLSIPASAALSERCWSLFARHLTSARPRLSIDRLNDTGKILSMAKHSAKKASRVGMGSSHALFFIILKASIPQCVMDAIGGGSGNAKNGANEGVSNQADAGNEVDADAEEQGQYDKDQGQASPDPLRELDELEALTANGEAEEDERADPLRRTLSGKENLRDVVGKLLLDLAKNVSAETMAAFL